MHVKSNTSKPESGGNGSQGENGDGHLLCEAPEGPLAAKGACHFFPIGPKVK